MSRYAWFASIGVLFAVIGLVVGIAAACPFCSAVSLTFAQEIKAADTVVIAELVQLPKNQSGADGASAPGIGEPLAKSTFRILDTLKGAEHLKKKKDLEAVFFGDSPVGTR